MSGQLPSWRESYRAHLLIFERYLVRARAGELSGEQTVYLAGMVARQLDDEYRKQIQSFLFEEPEELDQAIRRHEPYIGQNAPIVTLSRINAEFLTLELAFARDGRAGLFALRMPIRYFGVAAFYSHQAGNRTLGDIFSHIRNHYQEILKLLAGYKRFLEDERFASDQLPSEVWEKFGTTVNERNAKKESWERKGLTPKKTQHLSFYEVNRMLDLSTPN